MINQVLALEPFASEVFFSHVRSLKQPRAVLVENGEPLWFMSHGMFVFLSILSYGFFEDSHQARST